MYLLDTNVGSELRKAKSGKADAKVLAWAESVSASTLFLLKLHVPDSEADRDALIAATGLVHGMTVITRNVSDYQATGVELLNPWG